MNDAVFAEAMAHHQAGRLTEAAKLYRGILDRDPNHPDSLHLLGLITADSDPQAGIALIQRAMALKPGCAPHHNSLGHAYRQCGCLEDAVSAYGDLVCRALAEPAVSLTSPRQPGERIRLGIVSGFFCDHTLFKLFLEGWLTKLNGARFEILGFHTGRVADAETARCAAWCDTFVQGLPSAEAWREAVVATAPHVLLYPEVGIDPTAGRLAAQRLAPVQCVAWGQPETTGMPTIDAFLSSELMEPPDGDSHYTEALVRLPDLGLCYLAGEQSPRRLDRAALGLDPTAPVFWSGQALYKYLPRYDVVFPRIAAEIGRCQFVFIAFAKSQMVTEIFRQRLWDAFATAGLDAAQHVVILPPMSQSDYTGAVALADVILDTPEWSGGKSTLDCLAVDPAIVTLRGRLMRGRHTAAILRRIGCEATIAESLDDYVSIAARLARDLVWRTQIRQQVARGRHRAFDDAAYMRALEAFLADAASGDRDQLRATWAETARHVSPCPTQTSV